MYLDQTATIETEDGYTFYLDLHSGFIRISAKLFSLGEGYISKNMTPSHVMEVLGQANKSIESRYSCRFDDNTFWMFVLIKRDATNQEIKDKAANLFKEKANILGENEPQKEA